MRLRHAVIFAFFLITGAILPNAPVYGQVVTTEDIYRHALPSIMTLKIVKGDGSTVTGSAFFALKENVAITTWHLVNGASAATASFSSGEEFEVSGVVDKDEKRDIALIRIKVFGRPLLPVVSEEPAIGSRAFVIGAPRGLDFTISDGIVSQIQLVDGIKLYQFTCPASPGNSGGPLLNQRGEVIGVVIAQIKDGQNLNFASPISYAMGLDSTLPTLPFTGLGIPAISNALSSYTAPAGDKLLLEGTMLDHDLLAAYLLAVEAVINVPGGFRQGVPSLVYSTQTMALAVLEQLKGSSFADSTKSGLREYLIQMIGDRINALNLLAQAIREAGRQGGTYAGLPTDLIARAGAIWEIVETRIARRSPVQVQREAELLRTIPKDGFPSDLLLSLGIAVPDADRKLGIVTFASNSLRVAHVFDGHYGAKLKLKSGDLIVAAQDSAMSTLAAVQDLLNNSTTRFFRLKVYRDGEHVELRALLNKSVQARRQEEELQPVKSKDASR